MAEQKLIVSLVDRLSGPAKAIAATLGRLHAAQARNNAAMDAMRGRMLDAVGVGYALAKGLSAPINAAIEFESAMSDVKKVVDFSSDGAFKKMGDDIRKMSLSVPMAADGIAKIIAEAGQSGIAQKELLKFADIAAKVSVAWDTSAGETGEALAKLKTGLGLTLDQTSDLADSINYLSNQSAAGAGDILNIVKTTAASAKQFGFTAEQVAAIGTAMVGAGFESDVAATSILNVGRALTKGGSATARQNAAFKKLGLSSKQVAKDMQKNAVGTLQKVLGKIGELAPEMRAALVSDLFGDEARALGPLIANNKLLADTLGLVADKSKYAGSAADEYASASQRSANNLQLFKNRLTDLSISIGDALLPAFNKILSKIGPFVTNISDLAQKYPALTSAITACTAALVTFKIAMTGLRFAGLWMVGSFLSAAISFTGLAGTLTAVGAALATISAPLWLGIAVVVGLVAAAGAYLYQKWDRIAAVMRGVGEAIGGRLQPVLDKVRPVIDAIGNAADWAGGKLSEFATWLGKIFAAEDIGYNHGEAIAANARNMTNRIIDGFVAGHAMIFKAGSDLIAKLWEGMQAKFWELVAWLKTIPEQIVAAVGKIDWSSTLDLSGIPGFGGGGEPTKVDGAKADGGPVSGGKTYLVGERGPELFSPNRPGLITPNHAIGGGKGAAASNNYVSLAPVFNIYGASDPKKTADIVSAEMGRRVKASMESSFGGGGF